MLPFCGTGADTGVHCFIIMVTSLLCIGIGGSFPPDKCLAILLSVFSDTVHQLLSATQSSLLVGHEAEATPIQSLSLTVFFLQSLQDGTPEVRDAGFSAIANTAKVSVGTGSVASFVLFIPFLGALKSKDADFSAPANTVWRVSA